MLFKLNYTLVLGLYVRAKVAYINVYGTNHNGIVF